MHLPILYSRTSKGQVQTWQIFVDGDKFHTEEGIKGGTISVSKQTVCKPKNVGRANETTPQQQAVAEATAKWKKKIDGGYWENEADIDNVTTFWPMLAEKWKEYKDFIKEEVFDKGETVFAQAKLDGMRCIVKKDGMWSREGKPILSAPHIRKLLEPAFAKNPGLVFDGELYNHALKHNFNKLISLAKKQKPTPEQLKESDAKLQYWVYDVIDPTRDEVFSERMKDAKAIIADLGPINGKIRWVITKVCDSVESIRALFEHYIDEGFEGLMVRVDRSYQNKRTKFLLKYKEFQDKEYVLVDIEDGDGNSAGIATTAYFEDPNGSEIRNGKTCFKTGIIGDHAYAADLFKNKKKVLGQKATVVFFNLTPAGVPRFGKMKIIRDYE